MRIAKNLIHVTHSSLRNYIPYMEWAILEMYICYSSASRSGQNGRECNKVVSWVLLKTDGVKSHFLSFKHFVCFNQNRVISMAFFATSLQALFKSNFASAVKRLLSPHISHIKIQLLYSLFTLESILERSCLRPFAFSQL